MDTFILQNKKLADKGKVAYYPIIAIEEPESHLHPNAQKKLYSQINDIGGQKIISTHSSYIAGSAKLKEVRGFLKKSINVLIGKIDNSLNSEEIRKIKRQVINTRGELYFSKAIIFCEGETEEQALPLLIEKKFNKSIIELGINIVGIGGGGNYFPFIYFAEKLNIDWFILSDGEDSILKKLKKDFKKLINSPLPKEEIQLPSNIVYYDNEDDFEALLLKSGYIDEIEKCLKILLNVDDLDELIANKNGTSKGRIKTETICNKCHQNIFIEDFRNYNGEKGKSLALLDLLTQNKTKYPSILSNLLYESDKDLPPKINELFEKINEILNPLEV